MPEAIEIRAEIDLEERPHQDYERDLPHLDQHVDSRSILPLVRYEARLFEHQGDLIDSLSFVKRRVHALPERGVPLTVFDEQSVPEQFRDRIRLRTKTELLTVRNEEAAVELRAYDDHGIESRERDLKEISDLFVHDRKRGEKRSLSGQCSQYIEPGLSIGNRDVG
jgi:hypothetical protein